MVVPYHGGRIHVRYKGATIGMTRIAHISDLHLESTPESRFPGVGLSLQRGARLLREARPDFVVVSGDLTSYGSCDIHQLALAKEWLDALEIPYMALPGNHDLGANAERGKKYPYSECYHAGDWESTHFHRVFHQPPVVVKDFGPLVLVGLAMRDHDPDGALEQLERELDHGQKPTIVVCHYPLMPVGTHGVLATFGAEEYIPHVVPRLQALVTSHPEVILYAAGHVHAVSVRPVPGGPWQITAGGFGPGPSQWWLYEADDVTLRYRSQDGAGFPTFWDRYLHDDSLDQAYHWNLCNGSEGAISYGKAFRS